MTQQRQHERIEIRVPVVVVYDGREIQAESRNVSVGGMLIAGGAEVPFGAKVRVRTTISSTAIDVEATVRWVQEGAIGVQFAPMRAKETWAIGQLGKTVHAKK